MTINKNLFLLKNNLFHAGVLFPAANFLNFSQAHNPLGILITGLNLGFSVASGLVTARLQSLPATSPTRKFFAATSAFIENDPKLQKDKLLHKHFEDFCYAPVTTAFKFVGRQMANPLRVTAYSALGVSGVLLSSGAAVALLPGVAALAFGTGNFWASSPTLERLNTNPENAQLTKALMHPAVYYGIGYTMVGLMAGGGLGLLAHPLSNVSAFVSTSLGVTETALALVGMGTGKFKNPAAGFMAVSLGTFINAASGLFSGNIPSAFANSFAGLGEAWLAIEEQKKFNLDKQQHPENHAPKKPSILGAVSDTLTAPIDGLMQARLIRRLPAMSPVS